MRRVARAASALAVAAVLTAGLTGCSVIGDIISGTAGEDDVFTLAVGDCFNETDDTSSGETIESVPIVDCKEEHDYEVYSSVIMDDEEYPGETDTTSQAESQCLDAFEGFFGLSYDEAVTNDFTYFYPTTESWGMGDREILCMIVQLDEAGSSIVKTTGSLKGAGA